MSRAERLFALYFYLDTKSGKTLAELARRFEVSDRTIFRDLSALEASGVLIEQTDGRYRRTGGVARPVAFDSGELELVRLALAGPAIEKSRGPLGRAIRSLVDKLDGALRNRRSENPAESGSAPATAAESAVMQTLELAVRERRPVVLRYRSLTSGGEQDRGVDPWRLLERDGTCFLLARCQVLEGPRLFSLDRIVSARIAPGSFLQPPDVGAESVREA
ncbi:MAG: WYL domain-containing protein [Acidobacteria bacterium]|nr:WYL domain-containing protein [Acidobacteriota bacterium]